MAMVVSVSSEAEPGQQVHWVSGGADGASIDAWLLAVLEDEELRQQVRQLKKVELATVWQLTRSFLLLRHSTVSTSPDPLDVHRRLIAGLAGESLLVSSSMFLDTLAEAEGFFDLSFKTIKSRLGRALDTAASERAMRGARATLTAAEVFGDFEAARAYMHTPNYALGGHTPAELIKTSEGERIVLNELQTQAEGGPL
ncbi:MAG: MbcA/ParS/Xre antitoxin family protein [Cyanobacteria bacterium]|nr:MbcA/ParS/Xre antitoxin family protein [Cyanobacteriota bacterium]